MTSKEHKKHADIARPLYGNFSRNEWAIMGTHCSLVKALADKIIEALSPVYKCAYVDAHHANVAQEDLLPGRLLKGAVTEYTDQINYHQFNYKKTFDQFRYREMFNDADIVLVNGNHHEARKQVVVIDETKRVSLLKRLSQLTNVELFLLTDEVVEIFDFIKEAIPGWQKIPVYKLNDTGGIVNFFSSRMNDLRPILNGLVLAGGKSMRMGFNKGSINWHGKEQQYYIADLLKDLCTGVFISCRAEQQQEINGNYKMLFDTFAGLGPYGAILSAFREQPDSAWIVVACDLPLLDYKTLQHLRTHRNIASFATTFESPYDGLPEPLITIWEPKAYPVLLSFLSQGYSCPRKVLRNNDITTIKAEDPDVLMNVNTPQDLEKVKIIMQTKTTIA